MDNTYWHKQQPGQALYESLLWSRPENRAFAGKLLVVGGHAQGFARPAEAFGLAEKHGIGTVRVLLPDVLQKTLGRVFVGAEFAPSTPSGSFASQALGELLPLSAWSDGVLLAGDLGRNSETAVLIEKFLEHYEGHVTITCDAADYLVTTPYPALQRPATLLMVSFAQLQKFGIGIKYSNAFTFSMDLLRLIESLHELTKRYKLAIITKHLDTIFLAVDGHVSTTKAPADLAVWRLKVAVAASVWGIQNPERLFEAYTTAIHTFLIDK